MRADFKAILIILVLLILFSINSFAAIPPEQTTLDIYQVSAVTPYESISNEQVAAIIPTDIPSGASEQTITKMVMDKALKSALKSNIVKGSSIGQTAQNLKDGLNTEMAIGAPNPADPEAIQHKFKVKVDPIQTRAKLQYIGYVNASASYQGGTAQYEITEDFEAYKLNLTHISNSTEDLSMMQVQWAW